MEPDRLRCHSERLVLRPALSKAIEEHVGVHTEEVLGSVCTEEAEGLVIVGHRSSHPDQGFKRWPGVVLDAAVHAVEGARLSRIRRGGLR